jgi:mRNA interferase MazF
MNRGEIWWADLPEPNGSTPGFMRPVLIVQADSYNKSRISSVICVVITSNIKLAQAPGNVLLQKKLTGLPKDSVANISQIITIDRTVLFDHLETVPASIMETIDHGLRQVLNLATYSA